MSSMPQSRQSGGAFLFTLRAAISGYADDGSSIYSGAGCRPASMGTFRTRVAVGSVRGLVLLHGQILVSCPPPYRAIDAGVDDCFRTIDSPAADISSDPGDSSVFRISSKPVDTPRIFSVRRQSSDLLRLPQSLTCIGGIGRIAVQQPPRARRHVHPAVNPRIAGDRIDHREVVLIVADALPG